MPLDIKDKNIRNQRLAKKEKNPHNPNTIR